MQTLIVANGVGTELELAGINENTIKIAKRFYRTSTDSISFVVDMTRPGNAFWFLTADTARAMELLADRAIGPVIAARTIKDNKKSAAAARVAARTAEAVTKAGPDARRVSHVKFGAGTVVSEDEKAVTVLFDGAKKPVRMVASFLTAL